MKYSVVESFTVNSRIGPLVFPVGKLLELTEEQAAKLKGKIQIADVPAVPPSDWRPPFKAWLENDQLRTQGVTDDLASEIAKLTNGNLPLQKKLLSLHVGTFRNPCWTSTARKFIQRAKELFDGGIGLHEANYRAAEEMYLLAFSDELGIIFYGSATNNPDPF